MDFRRIFPQIALELPMPMLLVQYGPLIVCHHRSHCVWIYLDLDLHEKHVAYMAPNFLSSWVGLVHFFFPPTTPLPMLSVLRALTSITKAAILLGEFCFILLATLCAC